MEIELDNKNTKTDGIGSRDDVIKNAFQRISIDRFFQEVIVFEKKNSSIGPKLCR